MYNSISIAQEKKALLVIDVQENLVDPNSKMHIDPAVLDSFFRNVNSSIADFQNRGLPVIYVANEFTNPFMNLITRNVCKKGTKGTGLDKKLLRVNDKVYIKSAASALSNKALLAWLRDNSITELYLTGLFAEECVKATFKAGLNNDFKVTVLEDAIGYKNARKRVRMNRYIQRKGGSLIPSSACSSIERAKNWPPLP